MVNTFGDADNFGGWAGDTDLFDLRSLGEASAVDGTQYTDQSLQLSAAVPISFLASLPGQTALSAAIAISAAGLDASNSYAVSIVSSAGSAVVAMMPTTVNAFGQTVLSSAIPVAGLQALSNVASAAVNITATNYDDFAALDYVRLEVTVPEPETLLLLGLAGLTPVAAGLRGSRRWRFEDDQ